MSISAPLDGLSRRFVAHFISHVAQPTGVDFANEADMGVKTIAAVITGICVTVPLYAAEPSASQYRAEGNEHEFNLRLDQAMNSFCQALDANPNDPASYRAVAAIYMMRIAFQRGAVTSDDFLGGEVGADSLHMPKPPVELARGFQENAAKALHLAEQQVQARPRDADAHYQLGAAIALQASYSATIDGQVLGAFKLARRAYKENSRALELDPGRDDAGLIVGAYQYIVSTRSLPVRWLARLGGMGADKAHGIELIVRASKYPGENQTDALLMLALIYNRERRYDEALQVLTGLQQRYPDNRLLWLEAAATELRAGRFHGAERNLDGGFAKLSKPSSPLAFGEEALWYYKRGAAGVGLHHEAAATADLKTALRKQARGWVHGRAHTELGKLADMAGNHESARKEYRLAAQLAKSADDSIGLADAERLMSNPYRQAQGGGESEARAESVRAAR
jgi:tetratricopeptide (TPR) repeat protein